MRAVFGVFAVIALALGLAMEGAYLKGRQECAAPVAPVVSHKCRTHSALESVAQRQRHEMAKAINTVNPIVPERRIAREIQRASRLTAVNPWLLTAVAMNESNFDPLAVGRDGERGIMQITRRTAGVVGLPWDRAFDIRLNTQAGAMYLEQMLQHHGGSRWRALLAYNGGGDPTYPARVMVDYYSLIRGAR